MKLLGHSFRTAMLGFALLGAAACDGDPYSGFGSSCTAGHPAVARARAFSDEKLSFLYSEIYRLHEQSAQNGIEYGISGEAIPENLSFLQAIRIRPTDISPNIMLAGCMDEYIHLEFSGPEEEDPGIVLRWAAGTSESPYNTETEVIWRPEYRAAKRTE